MTIKLEGFTSVGEILKPGIYALVHKGKVVYIGKSNRMLVRIYTHRNNWGKKLKKFTGLNWATVKGILFDDVHVMPCSLEQLDELERAMIELYNPVYNVRLKQPTGIVEPFTLSIGHVTLHFNSTQPRQKHSQPLIERRL